MRNFIIVTGFLSAIAITILLITIPVVKAGEFDDEYVDIKENSTENDIVFITTEISKDNTTDTTEDVNDTEIVTESPETPTTDNPNMCSPSGWPCVPNKSRKPIKSVPECCSGICQFEDGWIDAVCS